MDRFQDTRSEDEVLEAAVLKATELIKKEEGFRTSAYPDGGYGWKVPTIGYGTARVYPSTGEPIRPGDTITEERAFNELLASVSDGLTTILDNVKTPLNENQMAALLSFVYNVGPNAFKQSSLLQQINNQDFESASKSFGLYNRSNGQTLPALTKRRSNEASLFNEPAAMLQATPETPLPQEVSPVDTPINPNPEMTPTQEAPQETQPAPQGEELKSIGELFTGESKDFVPGIKAYLNRALGRTQ